MTEDQGNRDVLLEILKWTKFQGMRQVKQILEDNLDTETKKLVYKLSDGKSSVEISRIAKVSDWTIRNYWKSWDPIQIVEIDPNYKGRYRKVFSLREVGVTVPVIPKQIQESKKESNEDEQNDQ